MRIAIWAALILMLVTGLVYRIRVTRLWIRESRLPETEYRAFLRRCNEIVPEDGVVYLVTDSGQPEPKPPRHDSWHEARAATYLYPRTVRPCTLEEARSRSDSDAWVLFVSEPFEPAHSWIKPIRDLR